jgi:hypothetical protein
LGGTTPSCTKLTTKIGDIIRRAVHIRRVEIRPQADRQARNEDLRIKYLMKEITKEEFECLLQRDDKKYNKTQELNQIFNMVSDTITDIMYRFLNYVETNPEIISQQKRVSMSILNEIDQIIDYANECLQDVSYTYSSSPIQISSILQIFKGNDAKDYINKLNILNAENPTMQVKKTFWNLSQQTTQNLTDLL